MSYDYKISATAITDTTVTIEVEALAGTSPGTKDLRFFLRVDLMDPVKTVQVQDPGMSPGDTVTIPVTGLSPWTEYRVEFGTYDMIFVDEASPIHVKTKKTTYADPKTATEEQWEDLTDRVNAKQTSMIVVTTATVPTSSTVAEVGQLYFINNGNGALYVCTENNNGATAWRQITLVAGGGGA